MKILNLGLDSSVLNKDSNLAKRVVEYGRLVKKYIIIVPAQKDKILSLTDNIQVYGVKSTNKLFSLFKIYKLSKRLIKEKNIGVISVQDQYYLGFLGLMLVRKFKLGLEIQVHGFEKYGGMRKFIAKYVLPRANAVRAVSQRLKRRLIEEFKVKEERIMVVPIHLESRITNYELRIKKENDKFIFLTIGRLVPVKNIGMQISAMAEVIKKYHNVELWIVGDGPERKKLELRSKKLELGEKVRMLGWQNNMDKYYKQADVFLLTSHSEGWPLVILEAANYGLPIIMTDVGSASELIINNESGIVIPVNDKIKLKEAMIDLIKNSELRRKTGEGARRAVFNLPAKEKILEMYKKSWELALINKK